MIAVVDYGVGNLFSLACSLDFIGAKSKVTSNARDIASADGVILPGVGAFADARKKLAASGLEDAVRDHAAKGKPLLGICLGMQMLFDKSLEYGTHEGLGFVKGTVKPIKDDLKDDLKIPHMGWNSLDVTRPSPLFKYVKNGEYVYFVHSFYAADCADSVIATSTYGIALTAAVQNGNVFGTQFHPEKSGQTGLNILRAFAEMQ